MKTRIYLKLSYW